MPCRAGNRVHEKGPVREKDYNVSVMGYPESFAGKDFKNKTLAIVPKKRAMRVREEERNLVKKIKQGYPCARKNDQNRTDDLVLLGFYKPRSGNVFEFFLTFAQPRTGEDVVNGPTFLGIQFEAALDEG